MLDQQEEATYIRDVLDRKNTILQEIRDALNRSHQHHDVRVIAVTKYIDETKARLLPMAGITDCAENRLQVAEPKLAAHMPVLWHFIGPVQMNKAKKVAQYFDFVHSVDRKELLDALDRYRTVEKPLQVLLQVNISHEPQKSGVDPESVVDLAIHCLSKAHLQLAGLMMIGTRYDDMTLVRNEFRMLRGIRDDLLERLSLPKLELSMGMSQDFSVAVEEGATMVRIGRFLVLEENPRT